MSRPIKRGLDYFPLDVVMNDDVRLVEAEFGLPGFAVIVKLFQKIYGGDGYYCSWTNDIALLFAKENGISKDFAAQVVDCIIGRGIFDKGMYQRYGILTSHGVQMRYLEAKRGDWSRIREEYRLLEKTSLGGENRVNASKTAVNAEAMPQNKEKEIKENESKSEETKAEEEQKNAVVVYRQNINPVMSSMEYEQMKGWLHDFDEDMIIKAVKIACLQNKRSANYVNGILNNWRKQGITTGEQAENAEKLRHRGEGYKGAVRQNSFNGYDQRNYTDDEFERIIAMKSGEG